MSIKIHIFNEKIDIKYKLPVKDQFIYKNSVVGLKIPENSLIFEKNRILIMKMWNAFLEYKSNITKAL